MSTWRRCHGCPPPTKPTCGTAYPFGLLAVPREEVVAVHGSSGTGGRPTLVAYTRDDLKLWARMCARALAAAGATPASLVHNAYGYGLFTGGLGIHQGAIELGATVVPVSGGMTARQVTLIRDLQPDILTCTPSYAIRLGEALAEAGAGPGDGLSLRAGIFGAEPWTQRDAAAARGPARASAHSTSTACPRSSGPVSPPSASSPPTDCT